MCNLKSVKYEARKVQLHLGTQWYKIWYISQHDFKTTYFHQTYILTNYFLFFVKAIKNIGSSLGYNRVFCTLTCPKCYITYDVLWYLHCYSKRFKTVLTLFKKMIFKAGFGLLNKLQTVQGDTIWFKCLHILSGPHGLTA